MGLGMDELHESSGCPEDLECPICMGVCVDAVACPCGHLFCRVCAERCLQKDRRCPLCRQSVEPADLKAQHLVNMRVNSLQVCCPRRCGWHGRFDQRRVHMKTDCCAATTEFTVCLRGHAGCTMEKTADQKLVVLALAAEGAAAGHNDGQNELCSTRKIRPGCVVVEVEGVRGDMHELVYLLDKSARKDRSYLVVFKQPMEFCTTVVRNSRELGLELGVPRVDTFLEIRAVMPQGAVQDHNRSNTKEMLKTRDRILEVNGVQGSGRELLKCIQTSASCTMRICRLPSQ